jgi:glycosyltransferase involved in cell wall biosynthesis
VPRLSILLPVRDAAPWLDASLASLARQTMRDLEIVAVDDGSTDGTPQVLARWSAREPRLVVARTEARGLPAALETARALARSPFLARHDGDDLSHRERFALQLGALARNPSLAVVGCRVRLFPAARVGAGMRRWAAWHNALLDHEAMEREAWIDSPLCHGTAVMRADALAAVGGWRDRGWAEDVDLWLRWFAAGGRFAKLPRTLYAWRQRPDSATRRDPRYARERMIEARLESLERRLLGAAPAVRVVGVGSSLATWAAALAAPGRAVVPVTAPRPTAPAIARIVPPAVLVFGAPAARGRWRAALEGTGLRELRDFAFVA